MTKKNAMVDASLAAIERTQQDLRTSIEASKTLAEKSEQLIARHRQQLASEGASIPPPA